VSVANKTPRVVAELGRPETPDETAARRSAASAKHRRNQTAINLVLALVASLGVVLLLVLVVVRPDDRGVVQPVDYQQIAASAQAQSSAPLAAPDLPDGWVANAAELRQQDDVTTWYIGFVTPQQQFIALEQGVGADAEWLQAATDDRVATGAELVAGTEWTAYDYRGDEDAGNHAFALSSGTADSTYLLYGTAELSEFIELAETLEKTR
jgi:hypothetical protein